MEKRTTNKTKLKQAEVTANEGRADIEKDKMKQRSI